MFEAQNGTMFESSYVPDRKLDIDTSWPHAQLHEVDKAYNNKTSLAFYADLHVDKEFWIKVQDKNATLAGELAVKLWHKYRIHNEQTIGVLMHCISNRNQIWV